MMTEAWSKSSYSNGEGGDCVEARRDQTVVLVRDTQNRSLGHLAAPAAEWTALLGAVRGR
ncbi:MULTISPECIES: DUF397 domain-containing protein [Nocardiopsis]|uniref:DUF397 domain-containing protein n=1 Tax=Nocardiopsis dassonvillei (strain ATCC 23218 / DSM 43111 / CIP 107115 / JCM 7437 / KCTC 9190 / NBRC 14626 / NCTC 10488 / NRRL B-5397 / IMRU 509) TaxID=446468 RepID=D7B4P1_NOCDD|nr:MULTISPECIES: DUF397 domain-containing protein [Nocardiopsis]ADH67081.1 protein of unknown function DUF397 [Nocardiopsis dassonvillei subsp. dassonvillei DSM 43111]NKY79658.1 DUF397 domain-containing protein [Nocardiopsis dassonvillei]VEI86992.1 Domain of uncharacterised function (DUF397) [Nocardiopsis dassonvillei]